MTSQFKSLRSSIVTGLWVAVLSGANCYSAFAGPLAIKDTPLFLNDNMAPLNMLVMGRDHRIYYEAYNDASDLNEDGVLDTRYKPAQITYFGYFDSLKCYTYASGVFTPSSVTANKQCSGGKWSGDWLNYVTTSRIDALRKVLYGGLRSTDTATDTVLQRSYTPQDAHSWGKEYTSTAVDGYDISLYTPFAQPAANRHHLFANTTPANDGDETGNTNAAINGKALPKLHVLENRQNRIWEWVSKERPVAGAKIDNTLSGGGSQDNVNPTAYIVRVQVCVTGLLELNCATYGTSRKPTGLIQDYGEDDSMMFGLMSGSYGKPHDGGVLRKAVGSVKSEINAATGQFVYNQDPPGIISTMDRFRVTGFNASNYEYACGFITTNPDDSGACSMWGNPTAEMMYEVLRYFSGKGAPTTDYIAGTDAEETSLGLKKASWNNPYAAGGAPRCAKPFQTVISDVYPSFDTDKIPGSYWNSGWSGNGAVAGFNASTQGDFIWNKEVGVTSDYFIGQSAGISDGSPKPKSVNSFGNIRGLSPEGPTRQGGYYASSVAYFGHQTDLQNTVAGEQKLQTFSVALASPLPQISIPVPGGKRVTLVPFAKSVGGNGYGIDPNGSFQPTNQVVDFYVDNIAADGSSGKFRVNFEDVEQGADHDMDAIALYEYSISGSTITVKVTSEYAAGGIIQHMGYVISGTDADGTYLVVRDRDTAEANDPNYSLDRPNDAAALPLESTRTFTPGSSTGAGLLKDPLWYAAKWGGFRDDNKNGLPDPNEWDEDGDGDPDNYFLVTNALTLKDQLTKAFNDILNRAGSASSASVNSGAISSDTLIFQAKFNSQFWGGELLAFPISLTGVIGSQVWNAKDSMPIPANRKIFTPNSGLTAVAGRNLHKTAVAFTNGTLDATRKTQLTGSDVVDKIDYLRGDRSQEKLANGSGTYRRRESSLGDIVNSSPVYVGAPNFRYPDSLETVTYSSFKAAKAGRQKMVYVGANDGMLHAFTAGNTATDGKEAFAYIPAAVFPSLYKLTQPGYSHLFYADGSPTVIDAFYGSAWHTVLVSGLNKGGQGVFALDVTDPGSITANGNALLWEFTDQTDVDLGYTYSRPAVVKMKDGVWAAVFGNGYNNTATTDNAGNTDTRVSATGNAVLYIVNIQTGELIRKIDTGVGTSADPLAQTRPNGLATPAMVDNDNDGVIDFAYAGDLFGNLWKFDLTSTSSGSWDVAYAGAPLFVATGPDGLTRQPITERPVVSRGPNGIGTMVLFGTGKFLEPDDRNISLLKTQSFYGVFDRNTGLTDVVAGRANLTQQSILAEETVTIAGTDALGNNTSGTTKIRVTSKNAPDYATKKGWYIDLVSPTNGFEGEMQVSDPLFRNGRVIFTTLIPDTDLCAYGGRSWLMEMDALSGTRLDYSPFDLNNDGTFDGNDYVEITLPDGSKTKVAVSGVQTADGITSKPSILTSLDPNGGGAGGPDCKEFKVMPNTSGGLQSMAENCGPGVVGRQSWRQVR
ncbi:MAG: PilC/PilY family type IV pilus protein [Steroidobacteraceae bacterium]